jgi:hypothetical protein
VIKITNIANDNAIIKIKSFKSYIYIEPLLLGFTHFLCDKITTIKTKATINFYNYFGFDCYYFGLIMEMSKANRRISANTDEVLLFYIS